MLRTNLVSRFIQPVVPLALLLGVAACGDDGDGAGPGAVQARLSETLPGLLDGTVNAMAFVGESEALGNVSTSLDALDGALALPISLSPGSGDEIMAAAGEDEELSGEELAQLLADELFNDANHEGGGVYRVPADLACGTDPDSGEVDADCVAEFDQLALRIRVA